MEETKRRRYIIRAVLEGEVDVQEEPGNILTVSSDVAASAYEGNTEYTGLVIEGDIFIGSKAFKDCTGLTFISAPNLTSLRNGRYGNGANTFEGCTGLTHLVFPSYGNYAITSYCFANCTSLVAADFARISQLGTAFRGCTALRTLVLRGANVPTVAGGMSANALGGMFTNASESTLYVPASQVTGYQEHAEWSKFVDAGGTITAIEGSPYEHKYVDGTPIA